MPTSIYQRVPHAEYLFDIKSRASVDSFLAWHHLRHRTYDLLVAQAGHKGLYSYDLTGRLDKDWLQRNALRHTTLRQIAQLRGQNTYDLMGVSLHNEAQVIDWQRRHAIDHGDLDDFFGVA